MSVFYNNALIGASGQAAGGYQIQRSLRFNPADSSFLSRTPASAGNRKTWTWAGWVKRSGLGNFFCLMSAGGNDNFGFSSADKFQFYFDSGVYRLSTQVFRDVSAWYHLVVVYDSPNATAQNRIRVYVNGSEITAWDTNTTVSQNRDSTFNATNQHAIARNISATSQDFPGYLADVHLVDGQALDPTSFGEFDTNNIWQPKAYSGTYGTNGFKLSFSNNASTTTISQDSSGNNNHWTANNLSVTAGVGNDSFVDSPSNYGTDTGGGGGGEVRGNYCTLNPLSLRPNITLANGNLDYTLTSTASPPYAALSTIAPSSGKWYTELTLTSSASAGGYTYWAGGGLFSSSYSNFTGASVNTNPGYGGFWSAGVRVTSYFTWATNDIIGFAWDLDAATLSVYKNGLLVASALSIPAGTNFFGVEGGYSPTSSSVNFGQRQWAYAAPAGFKALCTANLPTPTIADPSTVMDVVTYTGNGSTQTISGLGFSPDLVWWKNRTNGTIWHNLVDQVRGAGKMLFSNDTSAELATNPRGTLTAFTSTGFTMTAGSSDADNANATSVPYVAWTFDAGSSTVTNTSGSITSQVRANPSAGFSIVQWTTTGTWPRTVGHGLGVEPFLIIDKCSNNTGNWTVYHKSLGNAAYLQLNTTAAQTTGASIWNSTTPSSTVFSINDSTYWGSSGFTHTSYCFAPVAGYSAFGTYTGNGSTDGPFVYTGFRPAFILIKTSSVSGNDWYVYDYKREAEYNPSTKPLYPNGSFAEQGDSRPVDLLSNGFKIRYASFFNASGATMIFAAFAESPFALARAR